MYGVWYASQRQKKRNKTTERLKAGAPEVYSACKRRRVCRLYVHIWFMWFSYPKWLRVVVGVVGDVVCFFVLFLDVSISYYAELMENTTNSHANSARWRKKNNQTYLT